VSVSTVLQAYFWLENQGWIEPRPQSGFYVRVPFAELPPLDGVVARRFSQARTPSQAAAQFESNFFEHAKCQIESRPESDERYVRSGAREIVVTR